jgi:hypothetical protein
MTMKWEDGWASVRKASPTPYATKNHSEELQTTTLQFSLFILLCLPIELSQTKDGRSGLCDMLCWGGYLDRTQHRSINRCFALKILEDLEESTGCRLVIFAELTWQSQHGLIFSCTVILKDVK